jgi:hypothetical protein
MKVRCNQNSIGNSTDSTISNIALACHITRLKEKKLTQEAESNKPQKRLLIQRVSYSTPNNTISIKKIPPGPAAPAAASRLHGDAAAGQIEVRTADFAGDRNSDDQDQ